MSRIVLSLIVFSRIVLYIIDFSRIVLSINVPFEHLCVDMLQKGKCMYEYLSATITTLIEVKITHSINQLLICNW